VDAIAAFKARAEQATHFGGLPALLIAAALVLMGCSTQAEQQSQPADPAIEQMQVLTDSFAQWQATSLDPNLAPDQVPGAIQARVAALAALGTKTDDFARYINSRPEFTRDTAERESIDYYLTAMRLYIATVDEGLGWLEKCMGSSPSKQRVTTCTTKMNKKFGKDVGEAEQGLQYAVALMLTNTGAAQVEVLPSAPVPATP